MSMKYALSILIFTATLAYSQTATITPLGPEGGRITHLKGSLDDSVVIAVVDERELYRSLDGGNTWTKIEILPLQPDNFPIINDIAFHPSSSNIILLPTDYGLFRSTDRGETWSAVTGAMAPSPTLSVTYVPGIPSVLYGSDVAGVLRSTDDGLTWHPMKDNLYFGNVFVRYVVVHPRDTALATLRIVATTGLYDTTGIFFSSNGGLTWEPLVNGLPPGDARKIYTVVMDTTGLARKDYRILIGTADGVYAIQSDLLIGNTWQAVKVNNEQIPVGIVTNGVFVYDRYDSTTNEHKFNLYVASNSSAYDLPPKPYTVNNGVFRVGSPLVGPFSHPITRVFNELCDVNSIFVPTKSNKQKIYLGTSTGIFISTDQGQTWQWKNSGIRHSRIRNAVSLQQSNGTIVHFAAMYGGGVYKFIDGTGSTLWLPSNSGLTNPYVTSVVKDPLRNVLYATSVYTVYRSTDFGNSWTPIFIPDSTQILNPYANQTQYSEFTIRISPANPDLLMFYSNVYGLKLTTNGGIDWQNKQTPIPIEYVFIPENIEFDPANDQTIYFTGRGIYKSTNLGNTWSSISSNLLQQGPEIDILSLTINPDNNREMFVATVYAQTLEPFSLFKTTDGGLSWDSLNQRLPVYDVEYDRYDKKRLVAAGAGGIFATRDGGMNWKILSPSTLQNPFYLLGSHAKDANVYYSGSDRGVWKIQIEDRPQLESDSLYYFGSLLLGNDTTLSITVSNKRGLRNVLVYFASLSDTINFKYLGPSVFTLAAGDTIAFLVQYKPQVAGLRSAALRFISSDPSVGVLQILLRGHSFERYAFEKFAYDFGSVSVGDDSVVTFDIDNRFGLHSIQVSYIGNTDTLSFKYEGNKTFTIDTGASVSLPVRFTPKSAGQKQAYMAFTTSDTRFPNVVIRFQGTGVVKNFTRRRVLLDTTLGFVSPDGLSLSEYYKLWKLSLERAEINVDFQKMHPLANYNAVVYVQPPTTLPQRTIDSLQKFIMNGGTVVVVGEQGAISHTAFNTFLHDSTWARLNIKTGIQFNGDLVWDETQKDSLLSGYVAARPVSKNALTYKIDSVVLMTPGSLKVDTTVLNVVPLLSAAAPTLFATKDTVTKKISSATIAAYSLIGKGKIIAISDYDIWWNGDREDTTKPYGIFGGQNLRFALNIFGLVDNLAARLPQPTPQEAYQLISIPYTFADSSVVTLFKDLGPPNEVVWRMFGKWDEKKGAYGEFPKDFKTIRRGEGYWLITKVPTTINFGTTEVKGSEEDFTIVLRPGYNMIGNPFPYEVSWANSFKEDSVENILWFYDGKFDTTTSTMLPFKGYFVKNRGKTEKLVRISSEPITTTSSLSKNEPFVRLEPNEWKLQISAVSKKSSDVHNYVGMLESAANGVDQFDFSEPPASPTDYLSLAIRGSSEKLAADYRAISRNGQFWDITLASGITNTSVTLSLNKIGTLPSDFKIFILDKKKERVYDVTQSLSHTLTLEKKEYGRELRLIIGTQKFVEANTDGIPIVPLDYTLYQNYPNPFNLSTSIRYSIAHSSDVKLEIFNMLGQRVKLLVHEYQQIGTYLVEWDGTDDGGNIVATGVYYYRLEAISNDGSPKFINVKKMTLIK